MTAEEFADKASEIRQRQGENKMKKKPKDLTLAEIDEICFVNRCEKTCPLYEGCQGKYSDPDGHHVEAMRRMPGEVEVPGKGDR